MLNRKDLIAAFDLFDDYTQTVTLFCVNSSNATLRIRVSRLKYRRGGFNKKAHEYVVTIGAPNWKERRYLKSCKKKGVKPSRVLVKKI
ncbi:MAG: hypothetical protein A2231_03180 [Candidatus Firestonebacteria bacterium RIFOXYA2_FULL_40_8]|nr:MAG: hypothetical protein A2231_03180 [Candidatus Firestonebacteria bacterium RIFOXYA2_FULL_40_8]